VCARASVARADVNRTE